MPNEVPRPKAATRCLNDEPYLLIKRAPPPRTPLTQGMASESSGFAQEALHMLCIAGRDNLLTPMVLGQASVGMTWPKQEALGGVAVPVTA
ncbi:hypothetical protein NDU88_003557 [Pleurodeles waltl]|uniref:Uncharacterized protein n=1 Tax=Pleurodeles waltl TaxID=8319 RepID=A0AAV7M3Q9_PLEWA|nr:hypothetical protein NDU88_003557 [Pleurodeles waltl]